MTLCAGIEECIFVCVSFSVYLSAAPFLSCVPPYNVQYVCVLPEQFLRPCVFLICVCSEVNPYLAKEHTGLIWNRWELRHVAHTNTCGG